MPLRVLLVTVCGAALAAGCATVPVAQPRVQSSATGSAATDGRAGQPAGATWTQERSDLKADPAIRFGYLPNGMRYALMPNKTPPGQAAFRLRIDAGSLMERDDQLGLAHFMEHMIFNGSQNVPEGEFVKRLERLGLSFGGDTNASTSFDETIYSFDLPRTTDDVVDTALLLFRESADKALLGPTAIDRERGVVLGEERAQASPGYRASIAQYAFLLKDQLVPKRFPIGTTDILRTAPRERFVQFYESYYRPENATFVAVGDFDPDVLEGKIRAQFGDWKGQGPAGTGPVLGAVAKRGMDVGAYVEPGTPPSVLLAWAAAPDLTTDSEAQRRTLLRRYLVTAIVNRRFARMTLSGDPPFESASFARETVFNSVDLTMMNAQVQGGDWRRALDAIEQEQRRLKLYGVTQAELDREIKVRREAFLSEVVGANTRSSYQLAANILAGVSKDDVVTTPAARLAQLEEAVRGFDAPAASAMLRGLMHGEGPLIFVTSPSPIPDPPRTIAAAFARSGQVAVAAPANVGAKPWAYTGFGPAGRVAERREIADLVTTFVRFDNGVRLTVRPNRAEENRIQVRVRAGDGELDLPSDRPNFVWALRPTFVEGGLGRMTLEEVDDALAGQQYAVNVSIGEDNFALSGITQPRDLPTQMQVLAAYMTDAAFRPEGLSRTKASAEDVQKQLRTSPSSVLGSRLQRFLRSGDQRVGLPSLAQMQALDIAEVRRALSPMIGEPIEVVIAGDVTVDEAIRQTAATFGALPRRRDAGHPAAAAQVRFPAPRTTPLTLTHEGRPDQAMAYMAWQTDDFFADPQKARIASVLAYILRLRMTDELREKQGITYSPGAGNEASRTFPHYGYLSAVVEAPPERLDDFFTALSQITRALRDTPVTQDELDRAVKPAIQGLERSKKGNSYWITALSGAQADPRRLDAIRQSATGLDRVTPADVRQLARDYLRDDRAFRIVVVPAGKKAGQADGL